MKCCDNSISLSLMGSLHPILLWLLMLALPIVVPGQTASSVSREQMEKLDFMVGEWKGKGWMYRSDGSRSVELSQSTKVKRGKDSSTLNIRDEKGAKVDGTLAAPFLGSNFPLLISVTLSFHYDEAAKLYYGRLETSAGRKYPCKARLVEPKVFQVKIEFPNMPEIVTIEVTEDGEWHERDNFWMGEKDGWVKTQETVLKKVK